VSLVATNLDVRGELQRRQREIIARAATPPGRGCVAEGRDITTVVAPDADVRILLTADEQARLARRATELHGTADPGALAATRDQVLRRDRDDSTVSSFLTAAEGVRTIDSSALAFDQVVDAVLAEVARRTGVRPGEVRA
jgi:cytidylate kinase